MHINVIASGSLFAVTNNGIDFFKFGHDFSYWVQNDWLVYSEL
jgi:hypothetical protein